MTERAQSGPGWHETRLGPTWLVSVALLSALAALVVVMTMFPERSATRPPEPADQGESTQR